MGWQYYWTDFPSIIGTLFQHTVYYTINKFFFLTRKAGPLTGWLQGLAMSLMLSVGKKSTQYSKSHQLKSERATKTTCTIIIINNLTRFRLKSPLIKISYISESSSQSLQYPTGRQLWWYRLLQQDPKKQRIAVVGNEGKPPWPNIFSMLSGGPWWMVL